jgi:tetratricopeptide (TPR) repeat protein
LLVNCLKHLDRGEEAVESATQALAQFPGDKELLFRRATLYQDNEQFEEAIADYERVLTESTDKVFQSIDPSICGYKAHHNLALALQAAGRSHVANHHWRQALSEYPLFAPAWVSLARSYAALNELNQLEEMLGQMPGDESLAVARAVSQALLHERRNEILPAQRILEAAWTASGDPACLDELARVLIESGHVRNAVHPLRQLAEIQPGNPSVFCNLGHALHVTGQAVEAIRAFRRSLELRPESSSTSRQLVQVLIEESDYERASEVLEAALRFDPHNEGLITIHRHLASCTQT